jgi:hypothetical protein
LLVVPGSKERATTMPAGARDPWITKLLRFSELRGDAARHGAASPALKYNVLNQNPKHWTRDKAFRVRARATSGV